MKHFIFEEGEYELDPYFKRVREKPYSFPKRGGRKSGVPSGFGEGDKRQRCVVKTHYSRNKHAHRYQLEQYLTREGAGNDGGKPRLYGTDLETYRRKLSAKNFRVFLSPENPKIPLETLANAFMKRLETHTGRRFYWVGADHHNTAHPHTHLLINGVDTSGRDVVFARDTIKVFMREFARDISTTLVGNRTHAEMASAADKQLESYRFTAIDMRLKSFMRHNELDLSSIDAVNFPRDTYERRILHLCKLKLCERRNGKYCFEPNWDETLRNMGKYNSYLRAMDDLQHTDRAELTLYTSEMGIKSGKVTKIYKTDEVSDNHAVLLESVDGKAYFAPLFWKPKTSEGDFVELVPKTNEKGRLSASVNKIDGKTLYARVSGEGRASSMGGLARLAAERQALTERQTRGRHNDGFER